MLEEMKNHFKYKTWILVRMPEGVTVLDCSWVYKTKRTPDGSIEKYKARLVIKGYKQKADIDYEKTYSPVCRYDSSRILLCITATEGLEIKQFDVKTAFLYGELQETVNMNQPERFEVEDDYGLPS